MKMSLLVIFLCAAACSLCYAEENNTTSQAPFGLRWGMSVSEAKSLGIMISDLDIKTTFGRSYRASNLPRMVADADLVGLSFGYSDKLWRIFVVSQTTPNDPYGSAVKHRYEQLNSTLSTKYGRGVAHEYQDTEIWKRSDEFMMSLSTGRSWYYTDFETPEIFVQLGIIAESANSGYWRIIYECKSLRAMFESDQKTHEKDAL